MAPRIEDRRRGSMLDRANSMVDKYTGIAENAPGMLYDRATMGTPLDRYKDSPASQDAGYNDIQAAAKDEAGLAWQNSPHEAQEANYGSDAAMNDGAYDSQKEAIPFQPATDRMDPDMLWGDKPFQSPQGQDEEGFEGVGAEPDGDQDDNTPAYEDGGAIPEEDTVDTMPDTPGNDGIDVVKQVLDYGRRKYGLVHDAAQQVGSAMHRGLNALPGKARGAFKEMDDDLGKSVDDTAARAKGAMGFADGGTVPGGYTPDQDPEDVAVPESLYEDPGQQDANYRQRGLDGSRLGGAFRQAQEGKIADQRAQAMLQDDQAIPEDQQQALSGAPKADNAVNNTGRAIQGAVPRFLQYLTSDAAHPSVVKAAEAGVDPNAPPEQGRVQMIQNELEEHGPEAAWSIMQSLRQKAEASRHAAAAVYDQGNLEQATALANHAMDAVPNGAHMTFAAGPNGTVTATVMEGGKNVSVLLTGKQFRDYIGGKDAQFDHQLEGSPATALQSIAKAPEPQEPPDDGKIKFRGPNDELNKEAWGRYGWMYGDRDKRNAFIDKHLEAGNKYASQEEQADTRGQATVNAAGIRGDKGIEREKVKQQSENQRQLIRQAMNSDRVQAKLKIAADELVRKSMNEKDRNVATMLSSIIKAPMFDPQALQDFADKHQIDLNKFMSQAGITQQDVAAGGQTQAQTPQAQTPQAATPQAQIPAAPPINQRKANTTYNTPKGPALWTGTGWKTQT